jgi:hypothetical protein
MIGRPDRKGAAVPITSIAEFAPLEGADPRAGYDRVTRELNGGQPMTKRSEWGEGLLAHVHSVGEDGSVVVVDVWQDQAGMDAFLERLRPILERQAAEEGVNLADQMNIRVLDTTNVVTEG